MVQQRPLRARPGSPCDESIAESPAVRPPASTGNPSPASSSMLPSGSRTTKVDVVDVVLDTVAGLDQAEPEPPGATKCAAAPDRSTRGLPEARATAVSRSWTRSPTRRSTPGSRGPSAANSVSLPRRASEPTSVNRSFRSITCIPRCPVRNLGERISCPRPRARRGPASRSACFQGTHRRPRGNAIASTHAGDIIST